MSSALIIPFLCHGPVRQKGGFRLTDVHGTVF